MIFLLLGSVFSAVACFVQRDIKALIAYSSVRHMGVAMAGLLMPENLSLTGVFAILLSHAFRSSGLFFLANFSYEQSLRRQLLLNRGQGSIFYFSTIMWVFFLLANIAVPPLLSLLGELLLFIVHFQQNFIYFILIAITAISVSYFSIHIFSTIIHGNYNKSLVLLGETRLVFLISIFHFLPLILLRGMFVGFRAYLSSLSKNKEL